jgi:hypothetical protein
MVKKRTKDISVGRTRFFQTKRHGRDNMYLANGKKER